MSKRVPKIEPSKATRPRSAFDLRQRHMFTAHVGMLLPVMSLDLIPNDYVKINANDFLRCLPSSVSPFVSLRGVYEFYYVPYKQVWSAFDQFISGSNDLDARSYQLYEGKTPDLTPRFNLADMHQILAKRVTDPSYTPLGSVPSNDPGLDPINDDLGLSTNMGSVRLLDLLGYGRRLTTAGKDYISDIYERFNMKVTPFRLAAYQKIYFDHYRHVDFESSNPFIYTLDGIDPSSADAFTYMPLTRLRYRNSTLDYFTNVRPSIFVLPGLEGTVNTYSGNGNHQPMVNDGYAHLLGYYKLSHNEDGTVYLSGVQNNPRTGLKAASSVGVAMDSNHLSVGTLRAAFAVDKMLRISSRAGKTFQEQMRAHYGVDIPQGRDGASIYIGGFDSDIEFSDVTSTDVDSIGVTGGKGIGSGRGFIEYTAKEHGVLMCIFSLVPRFSYDCTRIDPMVEKVSRFDFFTPEFENLGQQPLYSRNISNIRYSGINHVIGYQPRYSEYKTALDINHGQFGQGEPLSYWVLSKTRSFDKQSSLKLQQLKIDPRSLNGIFPINYDGTERTDIVFGGCDFSVLKCSDMSEVGEPRI